MKKIDFKSFFINYEIKFEINPAKKIDQFQGKKDTIDPLESRTFRADVKRWMERKNDKGEWIVPIWEDRSFVEHILTPSESWEKIAWINQEKDSKFFMQNNVLIKEC